MPSRNTQRRKCHRCGLDFIGTGKYCPPETERTCRADAKREANTHNKRIERAGTKIPPGDYGGGIQELKDAYGKASPEKRLDMLEMHAEYAVEMRGW